MGLLTYADVIDRVSRVVYSYGASYGVSASRDQIRTAITDAYLSLPLMGPWRRYQTFVRLQVEQPFPAVVSRSGTILTLSSGAWPSWSENCTVRVGSVTSRVLRRLSDSQIELAQVPGGIQDGGSGTLTLYHDAHQLPSDFMSPMAVFQMQTRRELVPVTTVNAIRTYGLLMAASLPTHYVIERGTKCLIRLVPSPASAILIDIHYRRTPSELKHSGRDEYCTVGAVTVNGTAVTGDNTEFSPDMVGAVLRIGRNGYTPTDTDGFSPYIDEAVIASVESPTALTLESPMAANYTNAPYAITSLLDIDYYMYPLLVALTVNKLSQMIGREIPVSVEDALKQALAADQHHASSVKTGGPSLVYSMTVRHG